MSNTRAELTAARGTFGRIGSATAAGLLFLFIAACGQSGALSLPESTDPGTVTEEPEEENNDDAR